MVVTIEATPKEMTDLVQQLQGRSDYNVKCSINPNSPVLQRLRDLQKQSKQER